MSLWDFFKRFDKGRDAAELARRLGIPQEQLRAMKAVYREFRIPKRSGGTRLIAAPAAELKAIQRRIAARLLARLPVHPSCAGFRRGCSIVHNARPHVGRAIVVRMDLKEFFNSTSARRVEHYFRAIGWNRDASALLTNVCTNAGGLPQGAPTSPALSNVVNFRLDARLDALARSVGAAYTRYADDLTFSFPSEESEATQRVIRGTKYVVEEEGYALHTRKKLHIRRRHDQQRVTGLVVNERVALPRRTRRWLRAVEHREQRGVGSTLTPTQLQGWRALSKMVTVQSAG